jgi:antirestriction protein
MLKIFLRELSSHNNGFGFDKEFEVEDYTSAGDMLDELFEYTREQLEDMNEDMSYYNLEEYMITDWEWEGTEFFKINEYENLDKLVERVQELNELDKSEELIVSAYMENGNDFEYAMEHKEDGTVHYESRMSDIAYNYVQEGLFSSVPESISAYIDYEKLGRDMMIEGTYIGMEDCIVELHS